MCSTVVTGYNYHYFSTSMDQIEFQVQAAGNVLMALSPRLGDADAMYEIAIGGWENTKSVIRRCKNVSIQWKCKVAYMEKGLYETSITIDNNLSTTFDLYAVILWAAS